MSKQVDVAIIGAGSAGLTACGVVRKYTDSWALIDGGELGTTCARVGCMPSKAAIQIAEDLHRREVFGKEGIEGGEGLSLNIEDALERVEDMRDLFVDQVLANSIDEMQPDEEFFEANARFVSASELALDDGTTITAKKVIIATGSTPIVPDAWRAFGDRVLTTDEFFELDELPQSIAVIGMGVIGLELGQTLARWGLDVSGFDMAQQVGGLKDPEINQIAIDTFSKEFPLYLGNAVEVAEGEGSKLKVTAGEVSVDVDNILVCIGRSPNVKNLGLENAGIELDERGVPLFNPNTMQAGESSIFVAGDVTNTAPILHEANIEGRIAGYNATHEVMSFKRKTPLTVTFSDPNIVHVGAGFDALDQDRIETGVGKFGPLGRALIMVKNKGQMHVYADRQTGKVLGATIFGPKGENLGHLLAWCIEQELTVTDLLKMPFYHPTIEEGLQSALYDLKGKLGLKSDYPIELAPL